MHTALCAWVSDDLHAVASHPCFPRASAWNSPAARFARQTCCISVDYSWSLVKFSWSKVRFPRKSTVPKLFLRKNPQSRWIRARAKHAVFSSSASPFPLLSSLHTYIQNLSAPSMPLSHVPARIGRLTVVIRTSYIAARDHGFVVACCRLLLLIER